MTMDGTYTEMMKGLSDLVRRISSPYMLQFSLIQNYALPPTAKANLPDIFDELDNDILLCVPVVAVLPSDPDLGCVITI